MIELNYVAYHNNKKCRVLTIPLNNNKILIEYIDDKIRKEVRLDDVEKLLYVEPEITNEKNNTQKLIKEVK